MSEYPQSGTSSLSIEIEIYCGPKKKKNKIKPNKAYFWYLYF